MPWMPEGWFYVLEVPRSTKVFSHASKAESPCTARLVVASPRDVAWSRESPDRATVEEIADVLPPFRLASTDVGRGARSASHALPVRGATGMGASGGDS